MFEQLVKLWHYECSPCIGVIEFHSVQGGIWTPVKFHSVQMVSGHLSTPICTPHSTSRALPVLPLIKRDGVFLDFVVPLFTCRPLGL